MTKQAQLEWYRNQVQLLMQLDQALLQIGSTGAPSVARAQQYQDYTQGTNHRAAAALQRWEGLIQRREAYARTVAEHKEEELKIISLAEDDRTLMILMLYYLHGLTDQEIADQLFISREQANKRRNAFLRTLTD
ncbi:MAG: sigma-70 family RNA polymerase sigma factor [Clostridia bacterium]|nr:sigma-70 family RNA polymerase sigma factor [Clostridia bacterium]